MNSYGSMFIPMCTAEGNQGNKLYETMKLKLRLFQSQTKKRVASYIIVFIATGIFSKNVVTVIAWFPPCDCAPLLNIVL